MNKKLTFLLAGALTALAFSALPSMASAEEAKLRCESGAPCTYAVAGGTAVFSRVGGDTTSCTGVSGSGKMTNLNAENEATTGEVQLKFSGCKETTSGFNFACNSAGQASGVITTNTMVTHSVKLPGTTNGQGVLLTGMNVTKTCAGGFARTTVTGDVIGELDEACGQTKTTVKLNFTASSHGVQSLTTYTGVTHTLSSATNHEGAYAGTALTGTVILTWNGNVVPTC